jgi:hypothetical protein
MSNSKKDCPHKEKINNLANGAIANIESVLNDPHQNLSQNLKEALDAAVAKCSNICQDVHHN